MLRFSFTTYYDGVLLSIYFRLLYFGMDEFNQACNISFPSQLNCLDW